MKKYTLDSLPLEFSTGYRCSYSKHFNLIVGDYSQLIDIYTVIRNSAKNTRELYYKINMNPNTSSFVWLIMIENNDIYIICADKLTIEDMKMIWDWYAWNYDIPLFELVSSIII